MNQEIARRGPNFVVEFEAEIQETLSVSRYVRGDWRLRAKRTDLHESLVNEKEVKKDPRRGTLKMACIWLSWAQGCSPVSISTIKHPTLHISAFFVYAICLTTSGAIQ